MHTVWSSIEKELQVLLKETKKRQLKFRQVVEECMQNVRRVEQLDQGFVLQNLLLVLTTGMESKESRIVATSLSIVEFLLSHRMFDESYGDQLLNFFEKQLTSQVENKHKLKSLQVLILFCSYCVNQKYPDCDYLFRGLSILFKCLQGDVLQPEWRAAAEAGVRQTVSEAFELVHLQKADVSLNELTPSMTSAYLLFQDLCRMVSKSNASSRLLGHVSRISFVYQILIDCIRSPSFIENQVFKQLLVEVFPPVLRIENWAEIQTVDLVSLLMLYVDYLQLYIRVLPNECMECFEHLLCAVYQTGSDEQINIFLGSIFDLFQSTEEQPSFLIPYIANLSIILDDRKRIETKLNHFKELFCFFSKLVTKIPQNVFSSDDPQIDAQKTAIRILPNVIDTKYERAFLVLKIIQLFTESLSIVDRECSEASDISRDVVQTTLPMIQEILICYSRRHMSALMHLCYRETWKCIFDSLRSMQLHKELNILMKSICILLREDLLPLKDCWSMYVALTRKHILSLLPLLMDLSKHLVLANSSNENVSCLDDFFLLTFVLDYLTSPDTDNEESHQLSLDLNILWKKLLDVSVEQMNWIFSRCFRENYRICVTYVDSIPKKRTRMDQIFLQRLLWFGKNLTRANASLKKSLLFITSEFVGNLIKDQSDTEEVQLTGVNILEEMIHHVMTNVDGDTEFYHTSSVLLELFQPIIISENVVVFERVLRALTEILQSYPHIFNSVNSWFILLDMLYNIPMKDDYQLVTFRLITILSRDFLSYLPCKTECLQLWTKFLCRTIQCLKDLNVSLTCLGYIWNTIDIISRHWEETQESRKESDSRDLHLYYTELAPVIMQVSVLTQDGRPEIRNSSLRMIIDALKVPASRQFRGFWKLVFQTFLIPICEFLFQEDHDEYSESGNLNTNIRIHHSRNTLEKQWDESRIIYLEGVVKLLYQFWETFIREEEETLEFWSQVVRFVLLCVSSPRTELCRAGVYMLVSIFDCFCDQEANSQVLINVTEGHSEILFWERLWEILQLHFSASERYALEETKVPSFLTLMTGLKNLLRNSRHSFSPSQAKTLFGIVISLARSPGGVRSQELFVSAIDFFRETSFDKDSDCWNILFEELFELCKQCLESGWDSGEDSLPIRLSLEAMEATFQRDLVPRNPQLTYLSVFVELLIPYIERYSFEDQTKNLVALDSLRALVVVVKSCFGKDTVPESLDAKLFERIVVMAEKFITTEKKDYETVEGYSVQSFPEYEIHWRKQSYDIILIDLLATRLLVHEELLTENSWKRAIGLLRKGFHTTYWNGKEKSYLRFRHACRVSLLKWIRKLFQNEVPTPPHGSVKWSIVEETKLDILNSTLVLTEIVLREKLQGGSYPLSSALRLEIQDVFQSLLMYETLSFLARDAFDEVHFGRKHEQNSDSRSTIAALRISLMSLREKLSICSTLEISDITELVVSLLKDMDRRVFVPDMK